jgi:hypothetical protein
MQQVKFFTGLEGATEELANEINQWIRESGAKILQISGNIAPQSSSDSSSGPSLPGTGLSGSTSSRPRSDVFLIVLYSLE